MEAEVREIASRSIHIAKQREDRPNRLKELADASMMLDGLQRRLRLAAVEDLAPRLPAMEIIERVQTLTGQARRREPEVIGVRRDLAELEAKVHRLREAVAAAMAKGHGQAAGITVAELASLPSVMQQLASAVARRSVYIVKRSTASPVWDLKILWPLLLSPSPVLRQRFRSSSRWNSCAPRG